MATTDTVRATFAVGSSVVGKGFIAGVELEIEDVKGMPDTHWKVEEDGSLRNAGREFISPPLPRDALVLGFKQIHASIKHSKTPKPFTERTSIHVHVNMLEQTQEQVRSIVMWYALFEPVFFFMVDPIRKNNIHCVGLDQTSLSEHYRRTLPYYVQKWSKYTALNLLPLQTQGTIEFRHMEGHADATRFEQWLKTIENLWQFGQDTILKKDCFEKDNLLLAFDAIFGNADIKSIRTNVLELVADTAIDIKLALL